MPLTATQLSPRIGSEIGIDRETLLSGAEAKEIRRLLEARGVLVFRRLDLDDRAQVQFARTLGEVEDRGEDHIFKVSLDTNENAKAIYLKGTFDWHIDGTTDDVPTLATMLTAKRLAPVGGQTEFANTHAAYEDLPEADKRRFDKLRVVHTLESSQRRVEPNPSPELEALWHTYPSKTHPLVWTHRNGRKSLVAGTTTSHIEGMSKEEGKALLDEIEDWITQPRFVYRHEWSLGDLVLWDNTGVMHRALYYAEDSGRLMHRTTLIGEEPLV